MIKKPTTRRVRTADELGKLVRVFRKEKKLTLVKVSGISKLSMRFLSEFERGKETAALGKVLLVIDRLGLEIIVQPRGEQEKLIRESKRLQSKNDGNN